MGEQPRSGYVPGVHASRALAVTLVLAAHIVGLWTGVVGFEWLPWQVYLGGIDLLRVDHQAGGHAGLLLFFLVSGYIVSQAAAADTALAFAVKRLARLLPAMVIAVAITVAVGAIGREQRWPGIPGLAPDRAFSPWAAVEAVGLAPTFAGIGVLFVLWTLHVEYYWYLLLGMLIGPSRRRPAAATVGLAGMVLGLWYVSSYISGPVRLVGVHLSYVFVILIGRLVYLRHQRLLSMPAAVAGGVAMAALYAWTQWPNEGQALWSGAHPRLLAVAWAVAWFLLLLRFVRSGPWRPVAFVADISYGLYLFHIPMMFLVLPIVSPGGRWFALGILVTVAVTVALAWLSYRFVETPIRRAARARLEGGASRRVRRRILAQR